MKALPGQTCCVCGAPATGRSFAGNWLCAKHLAEWRKHKIKSRHFLHVDNEFRLWLAGARAAQRREAR